MLDVSSYVLSRLRAGDLALYRSSSADAAPVLVVVAENASLVYGKRLEHEYALRSSMDSTFAARPLVLARHNDRLALVLADPGGILLDRLLGGPLDVAQFLRIALPLANVLERLHARGLIHKDIKPQNILFDGKSGDAWFTGFGIAGRLPREYQDPEAPEMIAGTLAYMAPEQTGRMNRSIDARCDLYSLGVTFYEMLTGRLPFSADDPLEWVHCHIARRPEAPDQRRKDIPGPICAIIMKLLAKTPEERYQTAAGVESDLKKCLAAWVTTRHIEPFELGKSDIPDRLLIPEKLYGREAQVNTLIEAFDRIVAHGRVECVLMTGYSGIGKSSIVNELHKVLVAPRGLFAAGKFDQYKQNIPYSTLAQALEQLVRQILIKSDAEVLRWRTSFTEALGPNGQIIVNLIPELELIVGEQPPVQELAPQDAKNRFQRTLKRFICAFARPEHPLALFLDDLQWQDAATLEMVEYLLTEADVRSLLLIGAYRDNEVGSTHPLARALEAIRQSNPSVREIAVGARLT